MTMYVTYVWPLSDLNKYPKIIAGGSSHVKNAVPIVALNCSGSVPCKLDGVTLTNAVQSEGCPGCPASPAVRVFSGTIKQLTVMNSQALGGNDCVNAENAPIGNWVSRSWGGWTMVGLGLPPPVSDDDANLTTMLGRIPSNLTASGL